MTPGSGGAAAGGSPPSGGSISGESSGGGASGAAQPGGSGGAAAGPGGGGSSAGGAGGTASGGAASGGGSAGTGGKGSGCSAQSGLLFCEDFEKGAADAAPSGAMWTTSYIGPDMPRIVVDATSPAHSGKHSVSITAPLTNFQSFLNYHDASVLPRPSGEFYLRVWVRLNRAMADHHNAYLVLDRASAPGAGAAVRLGVQASMLSLTVGGDAHGSLSNANFSNDQMLGPRFTVGTWSCLEGYFNSATPTIAFWLDRAEITDFRHTDWPADAYDTLRFGFEKYAGPELTIWLDDVALGSSRIGCD